jgi:tetratricopeptide (TPR) repeat protein
VITYLARQCPRWNGYLGVITTQSGTSSFSRRFLTFVIIGVLSLCAIAAGLLGKKQLRPHLLDLLRPFRTYPIDQKKEATGYFELFLIGGSTALGQPFDPEANVGKLASLFLGGEVNGNPIRVHNRAVSGLDSAGVLHDAPYIASSASLVFLYSGHNEFLRFDTDTDLSKSQRTLFDRPTVSSEKRSRMLEQYRANLEKVILLLKKHQIPLVMATPASNVADWEPNRSVLKDPGNQAVIAADLEDGEQSIQEGQLLKATEYFQRSLTREPAFAWTHKRLADVYRAMGRFQEANRHYWDALDNDQNPYRATARQIMMVAELARQYEIPLIDAVKVFEEHSEQQLLGYNLFVDNCHPTFFGYSLVGQELAKVIASQFKEKRSLRELALEEIKKALNITPKKEFEVLVSRSNFLQRLGTRTWNPGLIFDRAQLYLDEAAKIDVNIELMVSYAILYSLKGDAVVAERYWNQASQLNWKITKTRLEGPYVRQIMHRTPSLEEIWRKFSGK